MTQYTGQTDQVKKVQLASSIEFVDWSGRQATAGSIIGLEIGTHFVGNGAEMQVELKDKSGKTFGKFKEKIAGNRFWAQIRVAEGAREELYAYVEFPKHGLKQKSPPLMIIPSVQITNLKWGQKEARRGDMVKLSADVKGVPDGTEATIEIWEHDNDGSHDFITSFTSLVKNGKIEAEWEYEYHEDTDEIPTEDEVKKYGKHYNPPEYFFRISIYGARADSGLLLFKDWIEIQVSNHKGQPLQGEDYVVYFADGREQKGKLDHQGRATIRDIPPGMADWEFPRLKG